MRLLDIVTTMPASARLAHAADTGAICCRFSRYRPLASRCRRLEPGPRAAVPGIESQRFLEQSAGVGEVAAAGVDVRQENERVGGVGRVVQREFELTDGGVEVASVGGADAAQDVRANEMRRGGIAGQLRQSGRRTRIIERRQDTAFCRTRS